ncbi:MAG: hypothetical protein IIA66_10520 [Planctomycetes bacterium]|nr:hypothetical protein [Planctomycetota bacterium]
MRPTTIIDTCRDSDHARAFIAGVASGCEGLAFVSTGICPGCETCREEYAPDATPDGFEQLWQSGEVFAEPSFSPCGCEICGSTLGGNFEPWHAVDDNGEIIHGDRACVDCLLYLANGDLPEKWEG